MKHPIIITRSGDITNRHNYDLYKLLGIRRPGKSILFGKGKPGVLVEYDIVVTKDEEEYSDI